MIFPQTIAELPAPPVIQIGLQLVHPLGPADQRCPACCHWSVPCSVGSRRTAAGVVVAMEYHAWFVWHLHVVLHQRAELVS